MRVLFIGSYFPMARAVQRGLEEEGIEINLAVAPSEAEMLVRSNGHDVILCDLRRPDQDVSFVKAWRIAGVNAPLLLLTSPEMGAVVKRVKGLNQTGIGMLAKPFHFEHLLARLYSLTAFAACV